LDIKTCSDSFDKLIQESPERNWFRVWSQDGLYSSKTCDEISKKRYGDRLMFQWNPSPNGTKIAIVTATTGGNPEAVLFTNYGIGNKKSRGMYVPWAF
jgi:hypothetical protein